MQLVRQGKFGPRHCLPPMRSICIPCFEFEEPHAGAHLSARSGAGIFKLRDCDGRVRRAARFREPFERHVAEHILKPLDMHRTTFVHPLPENLKPLMSKGDVQGLWPTS